MRAITIQNSIPQITFVLSKVFLPTALAAELLGVSLSGKAIAQPCCISEAWSLDKTQVVPISSQQGHPVLIATAYTDLTLPTLRRGDRGRSVQLLQQVLSDNGFLGAAGVRLRNPSGAVVDGVFGPITESAVRDLQQRYKVPVTGQVNPRTWEVLDMHENPYRAPLPWKG
ncbi:peptidoglycan-binding protein [Trichocoleus sp. FACHB-591]|uniref:peptidoglycan-binding domain-containing protein n=1 Tax=Trichocoleus sp. FACHB-591 TaxID=2692872 RepID=UPI00168396B7|nr:peptidoglycan-binding domain-containing protein [Trichocoleus sp. FACHB-591]MBD2095538.1 peptidoglycan-binding protein [Trichocoleus sp. FACHB-591]